MRASWAGLGVLGALLLSGCRAGSETLYVPPGADAGSGNVGGADSGAPPDAGPFLDAGSADAGAPDAGSADAGSADAGSPDAGSPDAGDLDGGPADAGGADAGGPADGGTDGGITFGGTGPWPVENVQYGSADGIQEAPVVGMTTDESQNRWAATHDALYLLRPGDKHFTRFAAAEGLHLPSNPVSYCDSGFGDKACPITGAAAAPGISEIVGGGPDEVFVGYYGIDDGSEDWFDPNRHSGKIDRVRLAPTGSATPITVDRFDLVATNSAEFWHNRTVQRLIYDHYNHRHELYAGTNHGVDRFQPDNYVAKPVGWFNGPDGNQKWMSDHLHPHACFHEDCETHPNATQMLGDWRGLALDQAGDLWVAGRWAAGKIRWTPSLYVWQQTPRPDGSGNANNPAFGDGKDNTGGCAGNPPVFCPPQEGDPVAMSAVSVAPDGTVWWASGPYYYTAMDKDYGIAAYRGHGFTYYHPMRDAGLLETNVRDLVALPDGRLALASPSGGVVLWDPATGAHVNIRGGQGIPDDRVFRLELDTMVSPPALHVSTYGGAAVLRILP